jgi:hypothetical protein
VTERFPQRALQLQKHLDRQRQVSPLRGDRLEIVAEIFQDILEMMAALDLFAPVHLGEKARQRLVPHLVDRELGRTGRDRQGAKGRNFFDGVTLVLEDQLPPGARVRGELQTVGAAGFPGRQMHVGRGAQPGPQMFAAQRVEGVERKAGRQARDGRRLADLLPRQANEARHPSPDDRQQHPMQAPLHRCEATGRAPHARPLPPRAGSSPKSAQRNKHIAGKNLSIVDRREILKYP